MAKCPNCNGTGSISRVTAKLAQTCPTCGGNGRVASAYEYWAACDRCYGYGWTGVDIDGLGCPRCDGFGIVHERTG